MAYDEGLAERVREIVHGRPAITERKMFGGLAFMAGGHVFVGILGERLMVRLPLEAYAQALLLPHVREMDFTGRPMKGYVFVEPDGYASDEALLEWVSGSHRFAAGLPPKTPGKAHRGSSPASSSGAAGKKRRP